MPFPASGDMTRRLLILNPAASRADRRGSTKPTYKRDGPAIWAKIEPARAEELEAGERLEAVVSHKITVYHTTRITHRTRLQADNPVRSFEILGITNLEERDRFFELACREVVA
jgi:SPP1 family predicted phage head-tail adaptor